MLATAPKYKISYTKLNLTNNEQKFLYDEIYPDIKESAKK